MLHILLLILKVIGIILLAILGILILLLLIVLFVPFRYQVSAESKGSLTAARAEVSFSWLLHFVAGHILYCDEELKWNVRITWKKITGDEPAKQVKEAVEDTIEEETKAAAEEAESDVEAEVNADVKAEEEKQTQSKAAENKHTKSEDKEKESKIEKIKYTIRTICDKIKLVLEFLKAETHVQAFQRLKKEIIRLVGFLKPKKIHGKVHFGMEDPYHTGQILAALSIGYPFYGEHVEIYPNFEQKILEGDIYVKGHVRGVYGVILVWNLLWDKQVRLTFRDIQKLIQKL